MPDVADPPARLYVTPYLWPAGRPIHRIHLKRFAPGEFNPSVTGNARFSPIASAQSLPIPTLYGGSDFECAAMETLFHDVPFAPGFKMFDKRKLAGQTHSVLLPAAVLKLADLSNVALRKLGVPRAQLIDTDKDRYPATRKWAVAIYLAHPELQGMVWVSRQDDRARALMLFGDRVPAGLLVPQAVSREFVDGASVTLELLMLAELIGVSVVAGHSG